MHAALLVTALLAWPHPGFDAEDSHFNPRESVITASTVGRLTPSWSVPLRGIEQSCSGFSAPVLGAGRIFATDRAGVSAYDPGSGAVRWRFTWDDADDNSTPRMAVEGGSLVLANGDCNSMSDPDGRLTVLDPSGRLRWKLELDNPVDSVLVDKGVVLVSGTSPSDEDRVAAYRVRDGRLLWSKPHHAAAGVSADGLVPLTRTNGYGQPAGETTAVSITTGLARWSRPVALQALAASPAGDRIYATDPVGALVAVRADSGATLWTAPGKVTPLVATDGPRVYLAAGRMVSARDAASGRRLWSRTLAEKAAQPVVAGGLLYTGGPVLIAATGAPAGPAFPGFTIPTGGHLYQVDGPRLTAYQP
ncbi:PQQ-binding-like beta-propeller repeat protein [Actinoplanes siamensis]|uniref:Pyrrolo-quinoline quinone repeat domain-containing protein n=1 Tax=Actinoplanes siamensis TaxID=1223317 RepID=A0A919NBX8_9ACTN|nr:PQQ-binding-like beta-propeller repeat protein [Actinoplanes siamensis]GIF08359.1 hypothetical protein Asi03nite_58970 [Actinoplanes siamensis]